MNAPVSQAASFAYGTALNALLEHGSGRNMLVGDSTVVFWAKAADPLAEAVVENLFLGALQAPDDAAVETRIRATIEAAAAGRWSDAPDLEPDTRFFILGLAPNSSRLARGGA